MAERTGSPGPVGPPERLRPAHVEPCTLPGRRPARRPEDGPLRHAALSRPVSAAFHAAACGLCYSDEHTYIALCAITAKRCALFLRMR